jgi:hypothetical protein
MAVAAGFKTIKPTKPDQQKTLEKLPSDKFSRITYFGRTYYVLPDKADGQAYVGGPKHGTGPKRTARRIEPRPQIETVGCGPKRLDSLKPGAIAQVIKLGGQPVQLFGGVRYYMEKPDGCPDCGLRFDLTFLFPKS